MSIRGEECLVVTHVSNLGLLAEDVDIVQAVITESGKCAIITPFRPLEIKNLSLHGEILQEEYIQVLQKLAGVGYSYCPGISYKHYTSLLPRNIISFEYPFPRMHSRNCEVWYKSENSEISKRNLIKRCQKCCTSANSLFVSIKRKSRESPTRPLKRLKTESKFSFHRLTPKSQRAKLLILKKSRIFLRARVKKLEAQVSHRDLMLKDEQSCEWEAIVSIINQNHKDELDCIFKEQGQKGPLLEKVWSRDSYLRQKNDTESFFNDQKFCSNGSKTNRWSPITLRIALALYCRSPAAYEALKSFQILQLPSVKTIQNKASKFNTSPGLDQQYMLEQKEKYLKMKEEKELLGKVVPEGDGLLIFDEVKVIEKVMWNSKNHEFIGFAMNDCEYSSLNDLLSQEEKVPDATQYVLQFLWRDLASDFDLIGPYFTFKSSVKSNFLLDCILLTMKGLQAYSFNTLALMCDGASENLTTIKLTLGMKGAFGDSDISPCFLNPFRDDKRVYWIICPSHELKSMISALHSSRLNGTKCFSRKKIGFGWKQLQELKQREDERVKKGQLRFVPKLVQSYIIRDSWTRLNVKPSKIFQQENVLSELFAYAHSTEGTKASRSSALVCYNYLRACNKIFEEGLLSSKRITSLDSPILNSISEGFDYFIRWFAEVKKDNPEIKLTAPTQTAFLSWQTWDLLRISIKGFQMLCEDFLGCHPQNFICPVRLNGSALESLFFPV